LALPFSFLLIVVCNLLFDFKVQFNEYRKYFLVLIAVSAKDLAFAIRALLG
jgi:hypothetical protein